ncbi:phosphoribosylformylglycinamidine cyclo-ligase [Paenibacillus oenotherae]|uniref:Phosphoribosylformylglycinamidine cyclo-ligase n=1 Tax=Paenibacillus oenotherae TaxID=1435645 RepID=A0ABS7DDC1_9BACL|nr:phosphoribosylformylglycinamidine cyclo-ligase [Paenibacillus oenotherae]MBW7477651.1 phosphoribosylformylglycinamidine cyclo-ligase [Paenibacillus oenotherae]
MEKKRTYTDAGVDIRNADQTKAELKHVMATGDPRVMNKPGAFASLFAADFAGIDNPVLVLKAEEPGSKQLLAFQHGRIEQICRDLIHHLVNDIIVMGAKPEVVLDTILCGKLERETVVDIVKHLSQACREQDCSLIGGETSEQPGLLSEGHYMLNASILGVVDRNKIIDGSRIRQGDKVLAIASNGPHTNGYSLVRKIMEESPEIVDQTIDGESFLDAILRPHTCYYRPLKELFEMPELHGLAHITGGGIAGNLNRILPQGTNARIDCSTIDILPVFNAIYTFGQVPPEDMLQTFNLGVGMTVVADPAGVQLIIEHLRKHGCPAYEIGEIVKGDQVVEFIGQLQWYNR